MAPKSIDGEWVEDFRPKYSGGMGGRDFTTENNTWTYTWSVFHDPEGLAQRMGGKEAAVERLDQLFREGFHEAGKSKYVYLGQFPDSTGLMASSPWQRALLPYPLPVQLFRPALEDPTPFAGADGHLVPQQPHGIWRR